MQSRLKNEGRIVYVLLMRLVTIPYPRFFTYNTLQPARDILARATAARNASSPSEARLETVKLHHLIAGWRSRKRSELDFVAVAGAILTAIVTASLSWPSIETAYWLAPSFWFISLSLSVNCILIAATQITLLSLIGILPDMPPPDGTAKVRRDHQLAVSRYLNQILKNSGLPAEIGSEVWILSWRSIFSLQAPMMFMAYSFLFYFFGLVLLIASPIIRNLQGEPWSTESQTAAVSLAGTAASWLLWAICSVAGHRQISLPGGEVEEDDPYN